MVVNLGPISPGMAGIESNGTGKDYNPRCLKRDINPYLSKGWLKYSDITRLINKNDNHYWFVMKMMGSFMGTAPKDFNVHTAGHSVIGGDPGSVCKGPPIHALQTLGLADNCFSKGPLFFPRRSSFLPTSQPN